MKDEDYIRKAVELADDFYLLKRTNQLTFDFLTKWWDVDNVPHWVKDILAAQLVRQLYATSDQFMFESYERYSIVTKFDLYGMPQEEWIARHQDRTMNTIKAIVDSEVLE